MMTLGRKVGGRNVKITTEGIKSILRKMKYSSNNINNSIVEYIWNGFDARATSVELTFKVDIYGVLRTLEIKDNGTGIPQDELAIKFDPFFESDKILEKKLERHKSDFHGRRGIGRLTFFTFANFAKWSTVYQKGERRHLYDIEINASTLEKYAGLDATIKETTQHCGTKVSFDGFLRDITDKDSLQELIKYLKLEFCWYLELNKKHCYKLIVNGELLDYNDIIGENEQFDLKCSEKDFHIRYVRWNENLNDEYSKFYYIDSNQHEKYKENTKLNNQGDDFFHSIYVESKYFDDFNFYTQEDPAQKGLGDGRSDDAFKELSYKIHEFLRRKRRPFLKEHSKKLIETLE